MGFIDISSTCLAPGDDISVGRLDLQRRTRTPVGDFPNVILHMEQFAEFRVEPDRPLGLLVGNPSDFDGRRNKQEFCFRPAVNDDRGQHDSAAV